MDTAPNLVAPAPARPAGHSGHHLLSGVVLFIAGLLVGGAVVWYVSPTEEASDTTVCTEEAKVCPDGTTLVREGPNCEFPTCPSSENVIPEVTFRKVRDGVCAQHAEVLPQWLVYRDGEDTGIRITAPSCIQHDIELVRAGAAWAVVHVPPEGIGGYILYGRYGSLYLIHFEPQEVKELSSGVLTDLAFSSDGRTIAYSAPEIPLDGAFEWRIGIEPLDPGVGTVAFAELMLEGAQVGAYIFSPGDEQLAFAAGYGPDPERGEVFVLDIATGQYRKQYDTPKPPVELFWQEDGTVGWR